MNKTRIDARSARDDPTRQFDESLALLEQVQTSLAQLVRKLNDGDATVLSALEPKYAELEVALKRAFEMERLVNDWKQKLRGRASDPAGQDIDFDRARHEIGCRLARLRACCHSD